MKKLLLLALVLLPFNVHAAGIRVASGTYTGTGSTLTVTVSPSFPIKWVVVKDESAQPLSDGADATADVIPAGSAFNMFQNGALLTTSITSVGTGQFTVFGGNLQNHSGDVYSYVAIGGDAASFFTSSYSGNSSTQNITAPGFQPTGVPFVKSGGSDVTVGNFGLGNTDSTEFWTSGQANLTGFITGLISTGFSLGNHTEVNGSGKTYYYSAYPTISGHAVAGSYTGNGTSKSITGLGFQPDVVIIKGNNTAQGIMKSSSGTTGTNSIPFDNNVAQTTTGITSLDSDGFSLGSDSRVNTNAVTYQYMAFKDTTATAAASTFKRIFSWW